MKKVSILDIHEARRKLGIQGERTALYCGGMYPDKKLDFLLDACIQIKKIVPDFEIIFIGSGPEQHHIQAACSRNTWMHFLGPIFGVERAIYFAISQVLLMPGLVGLAVVDSFVTGVPIFTTDIPIHSPEIAYLANEKNGIMTNFSVDDYASTVADYLAKPYKLDCLRHGCLASSEIYTLENMVKNFASGIEACLSAERR